MKQEMESNFCLLYKLSSYSWKISNLTLYPVKPSMILGTNLKKLSCILYEKSFKRIILIFRPEDLMQ